MTNQKITDINLEDVKNELYTIFKSPNPLSIYMNSKNVKDKFSAFITSLSQKISAWFTLEEDSQTFVFQIYKNCNYDKIWAWVLEKFLRDSKNFDLLSYIFFVKTLNKDKQYLARWLFKMYQKDSEDDIKSFFSKYSPGMSYESFLRIFNENEISKMDLWINLKENFVEHFIEKVYLKLDAQKRDLFLDHFILKINKENINFSDMSKILMKVVSLYNFWSKQTDAMETLSWEYYSPVKKIIDNLIEKYQSKRADFYYEVSTTLAVLPLVDRNLFWSYIKTKIIDNHYSDIKFLFYSFSSDNFASKDTYTSLKWDFKMVESISPEAENMYSDYKEINDLKEIILELSDNIFSSFILPLVYYIISDKLSISKKDLSKMKYLLLYIFSSNYNEYKKIYMFFNQLEVFLNYDEKSNILWKVQVWFSIILLAIFSLILSYFYLPIWVFLWIFLLSWVKYFEIWYPNFFYNNKWNVWIKFFAILFLCVSSYYWFQNFDKVKEDSNHLVKKVEMLWSIPTRDVLDGWAKYLKASILEFSKGGN